MQGNRVVVSRILTSTKFDAPRSMEERIREFVEANTAVSLYPFSADYAVKVAARKPPSADNKAKRKKAAGKNKRIGMGIFDPDATKKPGQTFYPYVRKFNRDGSAGDKPNIGWLDPIRTMKPSEMVNAAKAVARAKMNSPQVIVRTGKKNPRTGQIDAKALGGSIGSTMGNIGQAAARAIGIVVDANGRFRCPPGVPAANQFTDEVGSNCFDFTPAVGRLMVRAAQNIGAEIREQLTEIDTVLPTSRDSDGKLRLRSTRGLVGPDGLPFDRTPAPETILGPDGLPIKHVYPDISPEEYASEVRRIIRETHPDWPDSRVEEYAKVAEQRARMYDKTRESIQIALDYFDELGIAYDENDPVSIQEASAQALVILKEKGWDIDLTGFYQLSSDFTGMDGELTSGNARAVVRRHNESIIQSVLAVVSARIISGVEPSIDGDDFEKWYDKKIKANPRYDGELSAKILEALRDGLSPSVFDDPVEREVYRLVASRYRQYQSTEVGFLLGFLQQHKVDPERTEQIKSLVLASPFDADGTVNMNNLTYNGETNVDERGLSMVWNPLAMIVTQPPSAASIGPFRLFETNSRGTEIARLKEIAESVSATSRAELLDTYLKGLTDFSNDSQEMARGEGFNEEFLRKHFGRISQGMYINSHEMVHVDQLSAVAYAITHDREGRDLGKMTNAEALEFALEIMAGGNDLVSFSDFLTDSRVWKSAIDDLPEITRVLLDSNLGGRYPKHEYYKAVVLQDFVNAKTTDERYRVLARYWDELEALKKDGFGQTAWATAIEDVITKYLIGADGSYVDLSDETLIYAFKRHNALTITELQAELGAALEAGLITETPEVRAIMAPLKLEKRLPDQKLRDADLATRPKKRRFALRSSRTELPVDDSVDRYGYETDEVFDAKLDNEVIGSTISLASRRDVSRWGASQRESVLESATPEQKRIVEGLWKKKRWFRSEINENGVTLSLALSTDESSLGTQISKEILPLADLVESSKLPNSVAVEINIPGGSLGQLGEDISDIDIETDSFITGIIKSNADVLATQDYSPLKSQRVIINVPEGSSGLPDYTPGTQKGEIGSLILPPGTIRVIGRRSDGTVMAKIDSQKSPLEQIEQFEPILERISSNSGNPLSIRVRAREAMIPIRGRRDLEKRQALRSQRETTLPRTVETQRRAIDTPQIGPSRIGATNNAAIGARNVYSARLDESVKRAEEMHRESVERIDKLQEALRILDETGEWRGGDLGVVASVGDTWWADGVDKPGIQPRNATKEEIEQRFGGVAEFRKQIEEKLNISKVEEKHQKDVANRKKIRREQGVLDVEDIPDDILDDLRAETERIRSLDPRSDEYKNIFSDGQNGESFVYHSGASELQNGILDPTKSVGTADGGSRGPGDTRGLNNAQAQQNRAYVEKLTTEVNALKEIEAWKKNNPDGGRFRASSPETAKLLTELNYIGDTFMAGDGDGLDFDIPQSALENWRYVQIADTIAKRETTLGAATSRQEMLERTGGQFLSAYPAGTFLVTQGYFGRFAGKEIPEEVAIIPSEFESRIGGASAKIFDRDAYARWMSSRRGTAWLVGGKMEKDITSSLGVDDEMQILGRQKPLFGISDLVQKPIDGSMRRDLISEVGPALMARAIRLRRQGAEISPESVLATRLDKNSQIASGLRSQRGTAASIRTRTVDILGRAKNIGVDIDKHEKQNIPEFEKRSRSDAAIVALKPNAQLKPLSQNQLDALVSALTSNLRDDFGRKYEPDMPAIYRAIAAQGNNGFQERLAVTREIAKRTDDQQLVSQIDDFVKEVSEMNDAEFVAAVRDAEERFTGAFDPSPVVAARDISSIIEKGRYDTVHQGQRTMGGTNSMDEDLVVRARKNAESDLLGFGASADSETTDLRPASSFILPRHFAERRRARLAEKYGDDVEIMHPYQIGREASNHMTYGPRQDARSVGQYGGDRIILKPDVAERTLAVNGDTLSGLDSSDGTVLEAGGRLSRVTSGGRLAANFHDPLAVLFHDRTKRDDTLVSPAATGKKNYVEGMIVGSFEPDDIQAVVVTPASIRDSQLSATPMGTPSNSNINPSASFTSIIAAAKFRDSVQDKYGIDAVINSREIDIDEVEPFNPQMTRGWVLGKIKDGTFSDVEVGDFEITNSTTPYEALLQYQRMSVLNGKKPPFFDHPDNDPNDQNKNAQNFLNMVDAELKRVSSRRNVISGRQRQTNNGLRSQRGDVATKPRSIFESEIDPFGDYVPAPIESIQPVDMASAPVRPNSMKLEEGPAFIEFGRDANGLPVVPPTATLKQKFGSTRRQQRRYFKRKYGITIKGEPPGDDRPRAVAAHYGALQALDDLLSNIDHKELLKVNDFVFSLGDTFGEHDDAMGTFGISTPLFLSVGKQKIRMHINHRQIVRTAEDYTSTMANSQSGKVTAESGRFVASFYLDASKISQKFGKDMDALGEEVARRTAYGVAVHEFGHLLDYAARHGGYKKRVPIRAAINPFKDNQDELMNRAYRSAGDAEFTGFDLSPSVYGSTSKQELVAEAFSAWWLFGRATGDGVVRIQPIIEHDRIQGGRTYGDLTKITDIGKTTITNLLEILGPRVKAAKPEETDMPPEEYSSDKIPAIAILYALSPFMMDKKE